MTSAAAPSGDRARVTVSVAVPPHEAFRLFTDEIGLWWRRGKAGAEFSRELGLWWADLLQAWQWHGRAAGAR